MTLIPYSQHRSGRVFDIDLAAPAQERWQAFGREFGDELHSLLSNVVALCQEHFADVPAMLRPLVRAAAHGASRLGGEYGTEIKGLAAAEIFRCGDGQVQATDSNQ